MLSLGLLYLLPILICFGSRVCNFGVSNGNQCFFIAFDLFAGNILFYGTWKQYILLVYVFQFNPVPVTLGDRCCGIWCNKCQRRSALPGSNFIWVSKPFSSSSPAVLALLGSKLLDALNVSFALVAVQGM